MLNKTLIEYICNSTILDEQKFIYLEKERSVDRDLLKKQDENGDNIITMLARLGRVELLVRIYNKFDLRTWKDNQHNTFLHAVMKAGNTKATLAILDFFQEIDLSADIVHPIVKTNFCQFIESLLFKFPTISSCFQPQVCDINHPDMICLHYCNIPQ